MTHSGSSLLGDLVVITKRLTDVLARENELLKSMRPQDIQALQKDKTQLARSYEYYLQELRNDPRQLAAAPAELRAELREATVRFQRVVSENERALRAVRTVSERLMKAIVAAVGETRTGAPAYSSAGVLGGLGGRRAVSVTLNKQL